MGEMSYLDRAKQVEARLRAARETRPGYERNEVTKEVTGAASAPALTETLYRAALHAWWAFTAEGAEADAAHVRYVCQEIVRLIDEVGEPRASECRWAWAREWYVETGCCPTCGEAGVFHEPEAGP